MNIGVAIVSTRVWKRASLSGSALLFNGTFPARLVVLMNIETSCCSRHSSRTRGGGLGPAPNKETYRLRVAAAAAILGNHLGFRSLHSSQTSPIESVTLNLLRWSSAYFWRVFKIILS